MPDRDEVIEAIRNSWSVETSGTPEEWTPDNPAKGHCDVSSFVAWDYLGGDLVLSQVFVDGEMTEHHYSNRIDGEDFDLTREQFTGAEVINEIDVVKYDFLKSNQATLKPEVAGRLELMRAAVQPVLGEPRH